MLLLGHPRLGAGLVCVFSLKRLNVEKPMPQHGAGPAAGPPPLGAWNINIRPGILLRPAKSRPRALSDLRMIYKFVADKDFIFQLPVCTLVRQA